MYQIQIKNNRYNKSSQTLKREINGALDKLIFLISEKENYGESFEKIFNNPVIKYDIFPNNFYTFKYHCHDSAQLRLLYRFIRNDDNSIIIELHDFYHKKKNDKKYIKHFEAKAKKMS